MAPTLRPYQAEDVASVIDAHAIYQRVIGRGATGLGKSLILAALAAHYVQFGRVMILVDVERLVRQLADAVEWYTGIRPGIEMGDERAENDGGLHATEGDRIVVGTVQTQYAGKEGRERYRRFDPADFSLLCLDECEIFVSKKEDEKKYREVVDYYIENRTTKLFGCSATTMRTDGVAMAHMFDHVAFDRDINWGIDNGYLVPGRQAFVPVSLDFSTLRVRKGEDGESDYSDQAISDKITNETTMIEFAKGIIAVAGDRRSIVVCPTVECSVAVADYLNGERPGCARAIYGSHKRSDGSRYVMSEQEKTAVMDSHQRGDYQFLSSCMLLTKGYDDRKIRAIFNCRKTRSRRLYCQIMGRGARTLEGTIEGIDSVDDRIAAILASGKPDFIMANMVGINDDVRDITMVDILGSAQESLIVDRAKKLEKEDGLTAGDALAKAEEQIEAEREEKNRAAERALSDLESEAERQLRGKIDVKAHIEVEWLDGTSGNRTRENPTQSRIEPRHMEILRRNKVPESDIARMTPEAAKTLTGKIIYRHKAGLCTYGQAKTLRKHGYSQQEVHSMARDAASAAIDAIARNGWKRPAV